MTRDIQPLSMARTRAETWRELLQSLSLTGVGTDPRAGTVKPGDDRARDARDAQPGCAKGAIGSLTQGEVR